MFDRILRRVRQAVRAGHYVMTTHGHDEMRADRLTVFDVEHVLLHGAVVERQRDRNTGEWEYLVQGPTLAGADAVVVTKLGVGGKVVIITVYLLP